MVGKVLLLFVAIGMALAEEEIQNEKKFYSWHERPEKRTAPDALRRPFIAMGKRQDDGMPRFSGYFTTFNTGNHNQNVAPLSRPFISMGKRNNMAPLSRPFISMGKKSPAAPLSRPFISMGKRDLAPLSRPFISMGKKSSRPAWIRLAGKREAEKEKKVAMSSDDLLRLCMFSVISCPTHEM